MKISFRDGFNVVVCLSFVLNMVLGITSGNITAVMGWLCATIWCGMFTVETWGRS